MTEESPSEEPSDNPLQWILPLISILIMGLLGYNYLFKQDDETLAQSSPVPAPIATSVTSATESAQTASRDITDAKRTFGNLLEPLVGILEQVQDEAAASEAMPKITELVQSLQGLGIDQAAATNRDALVTFLKPYRKRIENALRALENQPELRERLRTAISSLMESLDRFAE